MTKEKLPPALVSRRAFVGTVAAAAGMMIVPRRVLGGRGYQAPSDTVNVAVVGYVHGMGTSNIDAIAHTDTIVALCDLDDSKAARKALERSKVLDRHPRAVRYRDYRVMLEKQKDIDGVVVATPDHTHAVIAMAAMQRGKHVYVQKPLTRTISEARALTEAARRYKVVTQMGNQGHSGEGVRLIEEWIAAGAIGRVHEVHAWTDRPIWPQGMPRPTETPRVPGGLDWNLWVGPSPMRPYHRTYHPFGWRAWQDFGAGALGDMGCHVLDPVFQALKLGAPSSVVASLGYNVIPMKDEKGGLVNRRVQYTDSYPPSSIVHMAFPARGDMPPVKLHWYDGGMLPERPDDLEPYRRVPTSGTISWATKASCGARPTRRARGSSPNPPWSPSRHARRRRCRVSRAVRPGTRRTGSTRSDSRARRSRISTTRGRSPSRSCSATWRCGSRTRGSSGMRRT